MFRLIYFSPVAWASYAQRPHFFVRYLLDHGVVSEVLWVDPYATRLPRWDDLARPRAPARQKERSTTEVRRLMVSALPVEPLPGGWTLNRHFVSRRALRELSAFAREGPCGIGVGRPSAVAAWALQSLPHRVSFFDAMDDFPAFYGPLSGGAMARRERVIARMVDWVFCSSHALVRKFDRLAGRVHLVPNGYPMGSLPEPAPAGSRADIGYVGSIARWFDWPLVAEIARALPAVTIRLIGPEFVARPRALPANVTVLPECPREEAVAHVREFAVGLIPFGLSRLTASVDPIKYYEYMALGVPVWSTPFGEMAWRGGEHGVRLVERGVDWPSLYREAIATAIDRGAVSLFRRQNDWAARLGVVAECLAS